VLSIAFTNKQLSNGSTLVVYCKILTVSKYIATKMCNIIIQRIVAYFFYY